MSIIKDTSKKTVTLCLILPVLLTTLLYTGGCIAQFIINYTIWTSSGGTPGNGSSPTFPSGSLKSCFIALTVFPYSLYGIFICLGIFTFLIFMVMRMGCGKKEVYDRERNLIYSDKGTYGTSGFMTESEMHQILELSPNICSNKGIILGKLGNNAVYLPENTRLNKNVAVFGASGSMKSRAYARNCALQCVKRG
ncbi:MAG: VirD4-like conjugal transfer protein, CD1115 family, partial [Brevinema sp.]